VGAEHLAFIGKVNKILLDFILYRFFSHCMLIRIRYQLRNKEDNVEGETQSMAMYLQSRWAL
jgi:hypothetical protein